MERGTGNWRLGTMSIPMKISGFTIARNAIKFNYPIVESIRSILPICDEFIVNVGDSEDDTLKLIQSIGDPKIRIIHTPWDFSQGKEVLSHQTNVALKECRGDWAFYLQSDEAVHEMDYPRLRKAMEENLNQDIDVLRFGWFHFYGSYFRYRIDKGWYQKQDRIVRNNGKMESYGDAWGFRRKDGAELKRVSTGAYIYHYGWVHSEDKMAQRIVNAQKIGFASGYDEKIKGQYAYGDLNRFPIYFATHPRVMEKRIANHRLSQEDLKKINAQFWWYPPQFLKFRYKTGRRVKERIV